MSMTTILILVSVSVVVVTIIVSIVIAKSRQQEMPVDEGLLPDLGKWPAGSWPFFIIEDGRLSEYLPYFRDGANFWNDSLNMKLFTFELLYNKAQTIPLIKAPLLGNKVLKVNFALKIVGGELIYDESGDPLIQSASITIDKEKIELLDISEDKLKRAARHELGHVLRLAHDTATKLSVMYPDLSPTENSVVTAKDRQTIKDLYG